MTPNEYQFKALRTASELSEADLIHNGVLGLSGESGEIADHYKKYKFQGHELDEKHLIEELGDLLWYVAIMAQGLGCGLEEVMHMNIKKLENRYPNGFESERSINRCEKAQAFYDKEGVE